MAIFTPGEEMRQGHGEKRTLIKTCHQLARRMRDISSISGGMSVSPVAMLTTMGKKATRKATVIMGQTLMPSHTSRMGGEGDLGNGLRHNEERGTRCFGERAKK